MAKKKTHSKKSPKLAGDGSEAAVLPSASQVVTAFEQASRTQKALMIAGGLIVVGTSPYWVPAVWRSKRARQLLTFGAGQAFNRWFA